MSRSLAVAAFVVGLVAVAWVGHGYAGSHPLALAMTLLIGAFYLMGAAELWRFHQATSTLDRALADMPDALPSLAGWLGQLHPTLQNPVRLRVEGERVGLPGPAMTPYLVGLLVLLGMLGTFLGMVVTLDGAVLALESTTDLPTIRAALSAPVKGLGLAFGTSVAGVAASAMLGLMSAVCRRDRLHSAQRLDSRMSTSLRVFSRTHQREQTHQALQAQARVTPEVVGQLQAVMQAFMTQMAQQAEAQNDRLLARQDAFFARAQTVHAELASSVDRSLRQSLADTARSAVATIQPVAEATLAGIAREATALHQRVADTVAQQLAQLSTRFDGSAAAMGESWATALARHERSSIDLTQRLMQTAAEAPRAAAEVMGQLRQQLSDSIARDKDLLDERQRVMQTQKALLDTLQQAATDQRGAIDALVASSTELMLHIGTRFGERIDAESSRLAAVAAQLTGSAVEAASLGEAFGFGVQQFGESSTALIATLQRIEAALNATSARSDEQLAYCVAQAREIIDLSMLSQKQIVEDLQQLGRRQSALAAEAG